MKQFVHSVYFERNDHNYLIINEKDPETNQSKLIFKEDSQRPFWVTKPQYRNHTFKKEYEPLGKLDKFYALEHEKYDAAFEAIHGFRPNHSNNPRGILKSPYIYGIDIPLEVLIKTNYIKNNPIIPNISIGALDIETSMIGGKEIILMTYLHEDWTFYTGIFQPFLKKPDDNNCDYTIDDVKAISKAKITKYLDEYNSTRGKMMELSFDMLNINYFVSNKEIDVIKWVVDRIHERKPDLCSIWNIDFDFPYILDRIRLLKYDPADILCHPEVPEKFKFVDYRYDKSEVDHNSKKWHSVLISGYTRFIDGMALYARKRLVEKKEVSYSLQYIAEKECHIGKLVLPGDGYHYYVQQYHFPEYVAYNDCDVIPMLLMEKKNADSKTLIGSLGNSLIENYAHQSKRLTNEFFKYCIENGFLTTAAGSFMKTPFCDKIPSTGGMVLDPMLTRGTAVAIIKDYAMSYGLHKYVADLDVKSIYPTLICILNISKETKLSTCLGITGPSVKYNTYQLETLDKKHSKYEQNKRKLIGGIVENLFLGILTPTQNCVSIGEEYFNLLNYDAFLTEYLEFKNSNQRVV